MATLEIHHISVLGDHYIWLVREPDSGDCAVVDPAVGLAGAGVVSVFGEIRRRKDHFRGTRVGRT